MQRGLREAVGDCKFTTPPPLRGTSPYTGEALDTRIYSFFLMILPLVVLGRLSRNSTILGYL